MTAYRRGLVLLVLALAGTNGATAQGEKFETLDVVALGAHGEPVRDLRASEIRLTDNKQPQPVVYWRSDERRRDTPTVTVVVFDLSYAGMQSTAWNEAVRTMRQLESSAQLYFYVKTARHLLLPVHELPAVDAESLPVHSPWMEKALPPLEASLRFEPLAQRSGMDSYTVYLDLAARLAAFPGRKNLVCVGCLFAYAGYWKPFAGASAAQVDRAIELRQLTEAFHEARVAVYPVGGQPLSGRIGTNREGATGGGLDPNLEAISGIADATGGRAFPSQQVEDALREAIRDGSSSYRLAYLPAAGNWDGKVHKIAMSCSRAGVHLLGPRWYLAETLDDIARERRPLIPDIAVTSALDSSDIAVSASVAHPMQGGIALNVHVDAADVLLLPRNGRYTGLLAFEVICFSPDRRRHACVEPATAKLDLSGEQYQTVIRDGLHFPVEIPAGGVPSRIRAIVRDVNSGATGSVTLPLNEDR